MRKVDGRLMQRANRALVLDLVRADPSASRAAIVRATGLSPAAVSGIVDYLTREGLVREEGATVTGAVGRRPLRLAFNPGARLVVGVALDVDRVAAALVDLGGTARRVHYAALPLGATPERALDEAERLVRRALRDAPGPGPGSTGAVLGVGVAVPGMVRWPDGANLFSPNLGWRDVPLRGLLEERLRDLGPADADPDARLGPVLVDNEVRALALAEHHFGAARDARTAVFLDAGYGVGGAVIIDGALYRGVRGAAGELGHNTVEPGGPRCGCGNDGCLEVFTSASGLVARAREVLAAGRPSALVTAAAGVAGADGLTVEAIVAAAGAGDPLASALLDRAATYLGLAVANAVDNWDPELVVLSGPVIRAGGGALFDRLLAAEQRSVLEMGRARVPVVRATLGDDAKIVGAATLVIADYLAAPR